MKSNWTGSFRFSLINLPVKLGSSSKNNSALDLHMVRKDDGSAIKFTRVAEADGKEVPWSEIVKGYTAPDGSLVTLDRNDFEQAYGPKNREGEIALFTDAANIPPMSVKTSYWVQPDTGGEKTYALLASALQETGKVAVLTFAMRERVSVAVLRPYDGYLALEVLEWDTDMVRPDFPVPVQSSSEAEQRLAVTLIDEMTQKYDHGKAHDTSTDAVMAIVQAKIETGQVIVPPAKPKGTPGRMPADLTAALQASVDAHRTVPVPAPRKARKTSARPSDVRVG